MQRSNADLSQLFSRLAFFLSLKEANPFKVRAFESVSQIIAEFSQPVAKLIESGEIKSVKGVGKGSLEVIAEYFSSGKVAELESLRSEFPEKIEELLEVRGLGVKKIKALYDHLEVGSLVELEYACRENRLLELKGFGEKSQANVLKGIEEIKNRQGKALWPHAEAEAKQILAFLQKKSGLTRLSIVGEVARKLPVVSEIAFYGVTDSLTEQALVEEIEENFGRQSCSIKIHLDQQWNEVREYCLAAGTEYLQALERDNHGLFSKSLLTEISWSASSGKKSLPAECRELNSHPAPAEFLEEKHIKGVFHAHTTYSDGTNSLEDLVQGCMARGWEYLGISEHSQSAFYARGLKAAQIQEQREEVKRLEKKYPGFRIFFGIESDILLDGSLDYDSKTLSAFDFVIASIHQRGKLDEQAMTARLLKAIENPYTTWLGHWTGRLLLGRDEVPFQKEVIVKAAQQCGKGIELNSNPYRLDVDWKVLPLLKKHGVKTGIFPDAHSIEGLDDVKYGVAMARKSWLSPDDIINTKTAHEMQLWLDTLRPKTK